MSVFGAPSWTNNASATLAADITNSQTTITLSSGEGALFPALSGSQWFPLTLKSASNANIYEITYCTARSTDTLTIERGQEGTTALAFNAADLANLQPTAYTYDLLGEWFPSSYISLSSSASINQTYNGYYVLVGGSGTTQTLSDASTVPGTVVGFFAITPFTLTSAGGNIIGGNLNVSALAINTGSFICLQSNGANWVVFSASPVLLGGGFPLTSQQVSANETITAASAGAFVEVSGSSTTVAIAASGWLKGNPIGFFAAAACEIVISGGGAFAGGNLSGSTVVVMPVNSWICAQFDGTNWVIFSASPDIVSIHGSVAIFSNTTFTASVPRIYVKLWGGGGGATGGTGSSGAGGGCAEGWVNITPGVPVAAVIGTAGAGSATVGSATAGGTTSFAGLSATGGAAGNAGPGPGGVGSGGTLNLQGGAGTDLDGFTPSAPGGAAAGGGGLGGTINNGASSIAPTFPGGGGGSNANAALGQNGAQGAIYISW